MAVWSTFIDCQTFALGIALLLSTTGSSAMPAREELQDAPWWFDACSLLSHTRHSRSAHITLQHQMRISIVNLEKIFRDDIANLFPKNAAKEGATGNFSWLKNRQYFRQMQREKNTPLALVAFHRSLQNYAGVFYKLREIQIVSGGKRFDGERHRKIIQEISDEMKRLLCEVETELDVRNMTIPEKIPLTEMRIKMPSIVDNSRGFMLHMGIVNKYRNFLKKSKQILFGKKARRNKKKKAGNKKKARKIVKS